MAAITIHNKHSQIMCTLVCVCNTYWCTDYSYLSYIATAFIIVDRLLSHGGDIFTQKQYLIALLVLN